MNRRISVNTGLAVPQSFITKGKQRLKQHIDTVYLNNGDEFEIELYNPQNHKVLAKIELNGSSIGNGIILRPGERIFLERYIDVAKKFKFETYMVDGDNKEVENAIRNNGDVTIRFYHELMQPLLNTSTTTWTTYPSTLTYTTGTPTYNNSVFTTTSSNVFYNNTTSIRNSNHGNIETGRVEQGSNSAQSFEYDSATFSSYTSETNWWKLKPQSTKPVVIEDLTVYCVECGSKRKKDNHKFCPHCGTKY